MPGEKKQADKIRDHSYFALRGGIRNHAFDSIPESRKQIQSNRIFIGIHCHGSFVLGRWTVGWKRIVHEVQKLAEPKKLVCQEERTGISLPGQTYAV